MVRLRRTSAPDVIAVTGAAGGLGQALLERLAALEDAPRLLGLDDLPGLDLPGVEWRPADPGGPLATDRFEGASVVVHLDTSYDTELPAVARRARNVAGTAAVLEAAGRVGARVVLVTSADVWGALPDNPVPLPDDAPLRAETDSQTLAGDHLDVERLAAQAAVPVTVLRPATLVGGALGPSYDGQLLRQLHSPRLLAVRGYEPVWQLCHVEDLLAALELAALGQVTGPLGVGGDGALPQSRVEQLSGRRRLELPAGVPAATADRLQRLGLRTGSPRELDHLLGPLVVAADGLRAAGWRPIWTNEDALAAHLATRPGDVRAGAYTAAGATVALLGSAALVRRARRRRRSL